MYQIKLQCTTMYRRKLCFSCPRETEKSGIETLLYKGEENLGNICQWCLEEGSENFTAVLREYARIYRKCAEELEGVAKEKVIFPNPDEYIAVKKEYEKQEAALLKEL